MSNNYETIKNALFQHTCYCAETGILKIYFSASKNLVLDKYPGATSSIIEVVCEDKPDCYVKFLHASTYPIISGRSLYNLCTPFELTTDEINVLLKKENNARQYILIAVDAGDIETFRYRKFGDAICAMFDQMETVMDASVADLEEALDQDVLEYRSSDNDYGYDITDDNMYAWAYDFSWKIEKLF